MSKNGTFLDIKRQLCRRHRHYSRGAPPPSAC